MLINDYRLMASEGYYYCLDLVEIYCPVFPDELIFSGSGSIIRDSKLRLSISVQSDVATQFKQRHTNAAAMLRDGQVLSSELTYKLHARDSNGRWWRDCEIFITSIEDGESSTTITAEADRFKLTIPCEEGRPAVPNEIEIVALHTGHFPFSVRAKSKGGYKLSSNLEIAGYSIEVCKDLPTTKILIRCAQAYDPDRIMVILEGMSILSGKVITPLLVGWSDGNHHYLDLLHGELDKNHLEPLLDSLTGYSVESASAFLHAYEASTRCPYSVSYAAWHRAYLAATSGIEISALALCTAIEGIVKYRFTDSHELNPVAALELANAKSSLEKLDAQPWIVEMLVKQLERVKENKPTIKKSLKAFAKSNGVSSKQVARWESLRNKIAHFDLLQDTPAENEKLINDYRTCLTVFYKLLVSSVRSP